MSIAIFFAASRKLLTLIADTFHGRNPNLQTRDTNTIHEKPAPRPQPKKIFHFAYLEIFLAYLGTPNVLLTNFFSLPGNTKRIAYEFF